MIKYFTSILIVTLVFTNCGTAKKTTQSIPTLNNSFTSDTTNIAFPSAEGFGKYTTGGRGGKVFVVSNLNDDGAGSLRQAVMAKIPRIVVFAVAGTIHLQSKLFIKDNITIAGQTAPGDGICLADYPVTINGNNVIIRYLRFRMGDKNQKGGMVDGNGGDDALGSSGRKNIIVDHCSISWSTDEAFSVYNGDSTTLQWNLISEPLNYSYHFETGDKDYEHHGYGGIWGGNHATFHHNLFAHCNNRTPRFNGERQGKKELCDYVNNVIYNWGGNNVYAGEGGTYNIENNYYKYGPETKKSVRYRICNPYSGKDVPFGKWYVNGNFVDGDIATTTNNSNGVHLNDGNEDDKKMLLIANPNERLNINLQSAVDAFDAVLLKAGCILPNRDTLDQRIVNNVKNRTGNFIDVQGGFAHGTNYETTVNAWPNLKTGIALKDTDADGMPDQWEMANNLNPNNAKDASIITLHKYYTNIELYINSLEK